MARIDNKKIVVGMSGGVDSSMALVLLRKQGWQPIGISLKCGQQGLGEACPEPEFFETAKMVCKKAGAPYYVFDVAEEFKKRVVGYFIKELKNNRTPNPCLICNRELKFKKLFEWAKKNKIKYVATGHYARLRKNKTTDKYELLRAKDKNKDQTYPLCLLPQKWLGYIVFPLGGLTKKDVYRAAEKEGFGFLLRRKQSQDFCFAPAKCFDCFLRKELGENPGPIKDIGGNLLGEHQGLHFYTIGQRKGINLSGGPYFVLNKNIKSNVLLVTKNKNKLFSKEAVLSPYSFISGVPPKKEMSVQTKIRYRQPATRARLLPVSKNKIRLIFKNPQKAITPGQFAVFYQKNICLGGGKIKMVKNSS